MQQSSSGGPGRLPPWCGRVQRAHPGPPPTPLACPPGVVKSTKMNRTIVVRRDYLHYIKKYAR
jgi:hypothetical protein